MISLFVMSANQELLDQFFDSLLPTIDDGVRVYAITEGLNIPHDNRIIRVDRTEFHPNKYFNIASKMVDDGYIGIVNDDIIFDDGWLEDVRYWLPKHECFCPGFIETRDTNEFKKIVERTRGVREVTRGMFDAFYLFPAEYVDFFEGFDEDVVTWYDMDWFLKTTMAGCTWKTSKRITIQHLSRMTLTPKPKYKRSAVQGVLDKYGNRLLGVAGRNSTRLRREIYV